MGYVMHRRKYIATVGSVGIVGLSGCASTSENGSVNGNSSNSNSSSSNSSEGNSLTFGGTVSETGDLAASGVETLNGYKVWQQYMNKNNGGIKIGDKKYKINLKFYDDESNKDRAITLYNRLINQDNVKYLLGPYSSGISLAVTPIANQNGLPLVVTNGALLKINTQGFDNVFTVIAPHTQYMGPMVEALMKRDNPPKRAAFIYENDQVQRGIHSTVSENIKNTDGLELVYDTQIPAGATDVSSVITQAKSKNADLFLGGSYTKVSILATRAFKNQNYTPKAAGFSVGPDTGQYIDSLGTTANGVLGSVHWHPSLKQNGPYFNTNQNYVDQYRKYIGDETMTYHQAMATAGGLAYQRAMETAGSTEPQRVISALNKVDFNSVVGRIGFDDRPKDNVKNANLKRGMFLSQVQNKEFEIVYPSDVATAKLQYPRTY